MLVLLFVLPGAASLHRSEVWARSQFAVAERLHQELEARPAAELGRTDYQRVINAYHRIYFEAPASSKADPCVVAVAQLLEEMGRRFEDRAILQSAIQHYEFLRRQYPGSKSRFNALFRIGEIYKDDLHDRDRANEVFREFLLRYPKNHFAEEARKALGEPTQKLAAAPDSKPGVPATPQNADKSAAGETAARKTAQITAAQESGANATKADVSRVTGIRNWSTPDSIHVAIDLQQEVRYQSQRLDQPDRIFFDLFDTKLDSTLTGKVFELDSRVLKKIRVSQFKPRQTRVVLELGDASSVHASLMSNPPRLVVDVEHEHAAKKPISNTASTPELATDQKHSEAARAEPASERDSETPVVALSDYEFVSPAKSAATNVTVIDKPANNVSSTTSDGIKKTIVDADDSMDAPNSTIARLDAPSVKPTDQPASDAAPARVASGKGKRKTSNLPDGREAQPTAAGDRSLIRALGLKIGKIVIDPGHGGHDTGTIGPHGLEEKELVLDVSKRLGKLLASRMGAEVVYTRTEDTFIPLETRTAIANQEAADLFVSIHANSSRDPDARGVETYYLNFTSSRDALEVAARENAVSEESIHELQDLVKKIALKEKIEESREFAVDIERSLHSGLAAKNSGARDRGVKKAPFIVLIGANMPSILAEVSFLSNPTDERRLKTNDYRQRIAESLYRGMAHYVNGLSGVKVASKIEKDQ